MSSTVVEVRIPETKVGPSGTSDLKLNKSTIVQLRILKLLEHISGDINYYFHDKRLGILRSLLQSHPYMVEYEKAFGKHTFILAWATISMYQKPHERNRTYDIIFDSLVDEKIVDLMFDIFNNYDI